MESFLEVTYQRNWPLAEKEDTKRAKGLDNITEHRTRQGLDSITREHRTRQGLDNITREHMTRQGH